MTENGYWSSTASGSIAYSIVDMSGGDSGWSLMDHESYVRPVLASW